MAASINKHLVRFRNVFGVLSAFPGEELQELYSFQMCPRVTPLRQLRVERTIPRRMTETDEGEQRQCER